MVKSLKEFGESKSMTYRQLLSDYARLLVSRLHRHIVIACTPSFSYTRHGVYSLLTLIPGDANEQHEPEAVQ